MPAPQSTLLIVEPDADDARHAKEALGGDYRLIFVRSGAEALETVAEDLPDLLLLGSSLADFSTASICQSLSAHSMTRDIPVIAVAEWEDSDAEDAAIQAGAVDCLHKPLSRLLAKVRIRTQLELKRYRNLVDQQVDVDPLTGIASRRHGLKFCKQAWNNARRRQEWIGLALIEFDHFSSLSEAGGEQNADNCLVQVARALTAEQRRPFDLIARYADDEFICVFPDTDLAGVVAVGESLCAKVDALRIPHASSPVAPHVTVSVGVAACQPGEDDHFNGFVDLADQALFRARRAGRNQVGC